MLREKLDLLRHVLRREPTHPLHQVEFDSAADFQSGRPLAIKTGATKRRTGRPRLHWTEENMSRAWQEIVKRVASTAAEIRGLPYDNDKAEMTKIIYERAKAYKEPFESAQTRKGKLSQIIERKGPRVRRPGWGVDGRKYSPFGKVPVPADLVWVTATGDANWHNFYVLDMK